MRADGLKSIAVRDMQSSAGHWKSILEAVDPMLDEANATAEFTTAKEWVLVRLVQLCESAGERLVVFSEFLDNLTLLESALQACLATHEHAIAPALQWAVSASPQYQVPVRGIIQLQIHLHHYAED